MAIQDRLFGWYVTVAHIGLGTDGAPLQTPNLLQYYKDIEINFDCSLMEARTPHDTIVNGGAHFPRPKSRRLEITVSGAVPNEFNQLSGVAVDNFFDVGGSYGNSDIIFSFQTPNLTVNGVGIVTSSDISYPGEEAIQSIKIIARSYSASVLTATI